MSTSEPVLVVLKSGLSVPVDALTLLWQLEHKGLSLRPEGDALVVSPRDSLTDDDRAAIRQHRDELLALVRYVEEGIVQ